MELPPTLAERAWYALHCLKRDAEGEPPPLSDLEVSVGLPYSTLSPIMRGTRSNHQWSTFTKIALALNCSEDWLRGKPGAIAPTLTGILPPRPGTKWMRHGDVPGWEGSVQLAMLEKAGKFVPPAAFRAGADLPVFRPLDKITPEIAIAASTYAWETSTREEQEKYSTLELDGHSVRARTSGKVRAAVLRRPAVK